MLPRNSEAACMGACELGCWCREAARVGACDLECVRSAWLNQGRAQSGHGVGGHPLRYRTEHSPISGECWHVEPENTRGMLAFGTGNQSQGLFPDLSKLQRRKLSGYLAGFQRTGFGGHRSGLRGPVDSKSERYKPPSGFWALNSESGSVGLVGCVSGSRLESGCVLDSQFESGPV